MLQQHDAAWATPIALAQRRGPLRLAAELAAAELQATTGACTPAVWSAQGI